MKKISQATMEQIVNYMDDFTREQVCRELAPCEPEEFLIRYCELAPEFEDLLRDEFSIELVGSEEDGDELTDDELAEIKKHEKVRLLSKCGEFAETFYRNYTRVPENLIKKLSPGELASLVDAFWKCYGFSRFFPFARKL